MIQDILPHKLDNHFRPGQVPQEEDTVFLFSGESVLCRIGEDEIAFPKVGEFADWTSPAAQDPRSASCHGTEGHAQQNRCGDAQRSPASSGLTYLFDVDGKRYFLADGEGRRLWKEEPSSDSAGAVRTACGSPEGGATAQRALGGGAAVRDPAGNDAKPRLPEGYGFAALRRLRRKDAPEKHLIFAAITARHLNDWYRTVRFCGCCGERLRPSETERAMVCPSCGQVFYPRINPAVIVGVTHGDQLLLTRYAGRRLSSYALVAGFTEIGETLEETVAREVMEETGLAVTNIRYYKSQPWGYAADILAGYYCDVAGDATIHMDAKELKEAVWMPRADIPGQADDFSLTNEMMCAFRDGVV